MFLRYYRPEIAARFQKNEPTPLVASSPVMGGIKTEYEARDAEQLYFGAASIDDISDSTLAPSPARKPTARPSSGGPGCPAMKVTFR